MRNSTQNTARSALMIGGSLLLLIVLAMSPVFLKSAPADATDGGSAVAEQIHIQAAQPDQKCENYPVVLDEREHNRLISNGLQGETPEAMFEEVKAKARQDPVYLAAAYNFIFEGTQQPPLDLTNQGTYDTLAQGGCYTLQGVELYNQVLGRFTKATVSAAEVPAEGVNSGAVAGGGAFADAGGIGGDRTGIAVKFDDGMVVFVLKRCGNFVKPGGAAPAGLPAGRVPPSENGGEHGGPTPTTGPPVTTKPGGGKDADQSVLNNPNVPDQVKGCGSAGCGGVTNQAPDPPGEHQSAASNPSGDGYTDKTRPSGGSSGGGSGGGRVTPSDAGSSNGGRFEPAPAPKPAPTHDAGGGSNSSTPSTPSSD